MVARFPSLPEQRSIAEFFREIDDAIALGGFDTVRFDIAKLRYMSSAGLRIVAKLKQQYEDFSIINMSDDIYDVFVMVGFSELIDIKRK